MSLRNRVDPFGNIHATSARGCLMGNRGTLHNADKTLVREYQRSAWISCALEFNDRHREVMGPGSYTELFFLDEATALAAGHRPCATCRRTDYKSFVAAFSKAVGAQVGPKDIDSILRKECWLLGGKGGWQSELKALPDGCMIVKDESPWLVYGGSIHHWTFSGYDKRERIKGSPVFLVITPKSIVGALNAGYSPFIHPSVNG